MVAVTPRYHLLKSVDHWRIQLNMNVGFVGLRPSSLIIVQIKMYFISKSNEFYKAGVHMIQASKVQFEITGNFCFFS